MANTQIAHERAPCSPDTPQRKTTQCPNTSWLSRAQQPGPRARQPKIGRCPRAQRRALPALPHTGTRNCPPGCPRRTAAPAASSSASSSPRDRW
eukprot:1872290-Prymnesium_polylepis.1